MLKTERLILAPLCAALNSCKYGKYEFFYEADIRNEASIKLLHKFENDYEIIEQEPERLTTDSGKELELQGHIIKAKIS